MVLLTHYTRDKLADIFNCWISLYPHFLKLLLLGGFFITAGLDYNLCFCVMMVVLGTVLCHQNKMLFFAGTLLSGYTLPGWLFFAASEEKTEEATPHRKQEARKKGQVGRSADLNAALVILAMVMFIYFTRSYFEEGIINFIRYMLGEEIKTVLTDNELIRLYNLTVLTFLKLMAPIFIFAMVLGLLANFLQIGFIFAPEAIKPKPENINPLEGFKKIFSKRAMVQGAKALLKIGIVSLVIYLLIRNKLAGLLILSEMNIWLIMERIERLFFQVCLGVAIMFVILAVLDYAYQKWEYRQSLKMSKYEVKTEMKQTEGDPLIKSKLRERQRLLSMQRMMQSVPEATVIITNPTHLAVALKYNDQEMDAPRVIAKGADYLAINIKKKAQEHDIPVVEDKTLARSLYNNVEIGDYIPFELYKAVAEVLAAIYMIKKK